jgi:hypothetical protein
MTTIVVVTGTQTASVMVSATIKPTPAAMVRMTVQVATVRTTVGEETFILPRSTYSKMNLL